jgi:hypothetical protein
MTKARLRYLYTQLSGRAPKDKRHQSRKADSDLSVGTAASDEAMRSYISPAKNIALSWKCRPRLIGGLSRANCRSVIKLGQQI